MSVFYNLWNLYIIWITLFLCFMNVFSRSFLKNENENSVNEEKWLTDYSKDFLYKMQADAPSTSIKTCPPPLKIPQTVKCSVVPCSSDKECEKHQRCCFNGCKATCLDLSISPIVVDWIHEPPRRFPSGNSWLIPGNEIIDHVEPCDLQDILEDEDAVLCPHGYMCHIDAVESSSDYELRRGHCVKIKHGEIDSGRQFTLRRDVPSYDTCNLGEKVFENNTTFKYEHHKCKCSNGEIMCKVGKSKRRKSNNKG